MKALEEFLFYGIRLFLLGQCIWGFRVARKLIALRIILGVIGLLLTLSLAFSVLHALGWDGWIGTYPALVLLFGSEIPLRQAIEWLLGTAP